MEYFLVFFECDQSYEVICSNSTLLPSDFNSDDARVKDVVKVKPDLTGRIIAKSINENDMEIYKRRLEKKLNEVENVDQSLNTSSLTFLNESISQSSVSKNTVIEDNCEIDDADTDTSDVCWAKSQAELHVKHACCDECHAHAKKQTELLKSIVKLQKAIFKEARKNRSKTEFPFSSTDLSNVEPVIYNGRNLCAMGCANQAPTVFGQLISRELFTDEELEQKMLFPVRDTGRQPLSPTRSSLFKKAIMSRFHDDDEALRASIAAVNQLGIDLKRGRRKRKLNSI